MHILRKNIFTTKYFGAFIVVLLFLSIMATSSCRKPKNEVVTSFEDKKDIATLRSEGVHTLISDSGVTKYRIISAIWEVYEKADSPYWYFPEKLFFEKFDSLYQTEASVLSDTAYFFTNIKLWRLVGNVVVENTVGERFETEELFWDQKDQKIYSDKFIHIEKADRIIEGIGFDSNESMTKYSIRTVSANLPMESTLKIDTSKQMTDTLNIEHKEEIVND